MLAAVATIFIGTVLCIVVSKIACWLVDCDKKVDNRLFKMDMDDYKNKKHCAVAMVIVFFVFITGAVLYLLFTRW